MKKILIAILSLAMIAACAFGISACGTTDSAQKPPIEQPDDKPDDKPDVPDDGLKEITGVKFENTSVDYDGQVHSVTVAGELPEGVAVAYESNSATDAGEYNARATLTGEGFKTLTLTAKLTINKIDIPLQANAFSAVTADYDGQVHSITLAGQLPEGVTVAYESNSATDAGEYNAKATLTGKNYKTLVLTAKLTINKIDIPVSEDAFAAVTADYDGQVHSITLAAQLPEGVTVAYESNSATDAGEYNAKATLTGKNYKTLVLTAKLTINKAEFTGVTFENAKFPYDGTPHIIEVSGVLPEGTTVTYSCEENTELQNYATETGEYTITATLKNKNYVDKSLTAKLTITASDKERHIAYMGGALYFANALDGDRLYSYDGENITRLSSDIPYSFTQLNGEIYFRSYSAISSSVKLITGDGKSEAVASVKGEYLCSDDTNLYYANNKLVGGGSGIYKLDLSGQEPLETLVSAGKAKFLTCYNGKIYFADGENGNKLSSVSASGGERSVVVDEKITCLTQSNGYLFYTVDNLLGNYIANYAISSGVHRKLTSDAGGNLTVIGNKLYYINVDLLTSNINGKGIYSVDAYPSTDRNSAGTKVIGEENENYSSLTGVDGSLAYYRVSDQMLCKYDIATHNIVEILDGFVVPEYAPLSLGSKTLSYKGNLYYLDLYNEKALYTYNTTTKTKSRLTSQKVADYAIIGDELYFNAVSYGVNNDLYKIDLKLGGEAELISKNDANDVVSDGKSIFYVEKNAGGARTAIHKISNGTDEIIYTKGASYLTYYDGYIYFVDGKDLLKMPVEGYTVDVTQTVKKGNVDTFVIDDGVVYFREMYGVGWALKRLSCINTDGTGYAAMMTKNTDPLKISVVGNKIYYYTDTAAGVSGIYSISKNAREDEAPALILERGTQYFASEFTVIGNKIYFVNYYNNLGDSHLYGVGIDGTGLEKIS